jgi:O-antigen/teichoic acid export membrane protein
MFKTWKKNTLYISLMQIILLIVNFFLITIISREYGAEIYGEYASAKSLSVLLGTAIVLSLALVVTRTSSNIEKFDKNLFYTTYKTIIRNTILASVLVVPLSAIFGRNYIYVFIFLLGFVFNEMLHVALAFHQSKGDFVISSKQIILRTVIYGLGGWLIIYFQYSIFWVIVFQTFLLLIFYFVANNSLPKEESNTDNTYTSKELRKSGRKMVLTTLSAALISELDIVILGVFYSGPILGVLAWSRRILEGLHQLVGASLDIVFPEISKIKNISEINEIRSKLKLVILVSLFIPLLYLVLENAANNIFINVLGTEFIHLASIFRVVIFSLPFMLWSRVNIIFARAMHFEINLFKVVITAAAISYLIYFFISQYNLFSPEFGILSSQITFSLFTSVFVGRQIKVGIESR